MGPPASRAAPEASRANRQPCGRRGAGFLVAEEVVMAATLAAATCNLLDDR